MSVTHTVCSKEFFNVRCDILLFVFTGAVNESCLYVVVCFDDAIGVVPWNHVTMVDSTDGGEKCKVLWSDGMSYDAVVIFKGTTVLE